MTRVAVEMLEVSSSLSECTVSGSRFTVSTLMSSFLRVTSLRPGSRKGRLETFCQPLQWLFLDPPWLGSANATLLGPPEALPTGGPGSSGRGLWPMGPKLTAFAAPVEEEHQGDEEEGEQDACADGGPGDDAYR